LNGKSKVIPFSRPQRMNRKLSHDEAENLYVAYLELSKDELTIQKTRGVLTDVSNCCFKNSPLKDQERFNNLWTIAAFNQNVSPKNRHRFLAQMVEEGIKGCWVYHAIEKKMVFVIAVFGMYTADQKEMCEMCGSINHTGKAERQCHRCSAKKTDLDKSTFPIIDSAMTHERRLLVYKHAETLSPSYSKEFLRKEYGLSDKVCAFTFSKALRVPDNAIADLLHNLGLNTGGWVLALVFYLLNEQSGRQCMINELKRYGTDLKNSLITKMFQTKKSKMIQANSNMYSYTSSKQIHTDSIQNTPLPPKNKLSLTQIKKSLKLKGTDYKLLFTVLDQIILQINKDENYGEKMDELYKQVSDEIWNSINSHFGYQYTKSKTTMIGLLIKSFLKLYWIMQEKEINELLISSQKQCINDFFFVLQNFFPGELCKPSIHDLLHMIHQSHSLIPVPFANTSKTESLNIDHREATESGNQRNPEHFIILRQWTARLFQFLINRGYFRYRNGLPIQTGDNLLEILYLFNQPNSRWKFPPKPICLVPDWLAHGLVPAVCENQIVLRSFYTEKNKHYPTLHNNLRQISSTSYITINAADIPSSINSYLECKLMKLGDLKCSVNITAFEIDIGKLKTPLQTNSLTYMSMSGNPCILIKLQQILCCPKNHSGLSIERQTKVDQWTKEISIIDQQLNQKLRQISLLQKEATDLDCKIQSLENFIQNEYIAEQSSWEPKVYLKGALLNTSTQQLLASLQVEETVDTLLFSPKDIQQCFEVREDPKDKTQFILKFY
jgi:hypothetical protein